MFIAGFFGIFFGSMALLADGLHMCSHTVALGITLFACWYSCRHADDPRFSFGTGKVNALPGFSSAILLAGFALLMVAESLDRFLNPVEIYTAAISIVTDKPKSPDHYRELLPKKLGIVHSTIEVRNRADDMAGKRALT